MPTILSKRSSTAGAVPTSSQLTAGETAINTADGYIYTKHTDGAVKRIGTTADRISVDSFTGIPAGDLQTVLESLPAAVKVDVTLTGDTVLGSASTDSTTFVSQVIADGTAGTSGQVLTSRGIDLSPEWAEGGILQGAADVRYLRLVSLTGNFFFHDGIAPPPGSIKANGETIGNAASGATNRANDDTLALFAHYWTTYNNTQRPIQTSAGTPTTRGDSAAADWAANKRMPVLEARGEWIRGWDDGRGVNPGRALGSWSDGEIKAHTHPEEVRDLGVGIDYAAGVIRTSGGDLAPGATGSAGGAENTVRGVALLACIHL